jgi:uncharacterized membrane protein
LWQKARAIGVILNDGGKTFAPSDDQRSKEDFLLGAGFAAAALSHTGAKRWTLALAAGALVGPAISGRRKFYQPRALGNRHDHSSVSGNRGKRIEASIEIGCPAKTLFEFWRNLEQIPRVMRHVKSVVPDGGKRSPWKVGGPMGQTFEWDAEIINEEEGRFLAWQSLPGDTVSNAGSVWFEPSNAETTRIKVALGFDLPAGAVGMVVAELFGSAQEADLAEDLQRFKEFAESQLKAGPDLKG